MSVEEVEAILGKESKPLPTAGLGGNRIFRTMRYFDLGLIVDLDDATADGKMRVQAVQFLPILSFR